MKNTFTIMTIRGIKIRVDFSWFITFLLFSFILYGQYNAILDLGMAAILLLAVNSVLMLFLLVLLHELSHSFVAQWRGLKVYEIRLHLLGGVSNMQAGSGSALTEFMVAIAGPLLNVVLFFVFWAVELSGSVTNDAASIFIQYAVRINAALAIFNMLPGIPLDGGRVLKSIIWAISKRERRSTIIAGSIGQLLGGIFVAIPFLLVVFLPLLSIFLGLFGADGAQEAVDQFRTNFIVLGINLNSLIFLIWFVLIGFFMITASTAEKRYAQRQGQL